MTKEDNKQDLKYGRKDQLFSNPEEMMFYALDRIEKEILRTRKTETLGTMFLGWLVVEALIALSRITYSFFQSFF